MIDVSHMRTSFPACEGKVQTNANNKKVQLLLFGCYLRGSYSGLPFLGQVSTHCLQSLTKTMMRITQDVEASAPIGIFLFSLLVDYTDSGTTQHDHLASDIVLEANIQTSLS